MFITSTACLIWRSCEVNEGCKPVRSFGCAGFSTVHDPVVEIKDKGDPVAILSNKARLSETAREMIRRGVYPPDGGWNGWLGRYQIALVDAAFALE